MFRTFFNHYKRKWGLFRDSFALDDLDRSYESAVRLNSEDKYISADFIFIKAAYYFAQGNIFEGNKFCEVIKRQYPDYDPSLRFYKDKKITGDDIMEVIEQTTQNIIAENFLRRFLEAHSNYKFTEFNGFSLENKLTRESLLERIKD